MRGDIIVDIPPLPAEKVGALLHQMRREEPWRSARKRCADDFKRLRKINPRFARLYWRRLRDSAGLPESEGGCLGTWLVMGKA